MTTYSTKIHGPADSAPSRTNKVAICQVCGVQWVVHGDPDKAGCSFCDAPKSAITITSEKPSYDGRADGW